MVEALRKVLDVFGTVVSAGRLANILALAGISFLVAGVAGPFIIAKYVAGSVSVTGPTIACFAMGILFCICGIAMSYFDRQPVIRDGPGQPERREISDSAPQSTTEHVALAVQNLLADIRNARTVRRNLNFKISILELHTSETSSPFKQKRAAVRLVTSYLIENLTDRDQVVPLEAAFETSELTARQVHTGKLRYWHEAGPTPPRAPAQELDLTFQYAQDKPIEKIYRFSVPVQPRATINVEWEAHYEIDLPYREMWATATALHRMTVEIEENLESEFLISADCYRLSSQGEFVRHAETHARGRWFRALGQGVFLPYQGIFVRIDHLEQASAR